MNIPFPAKQGSGAPQVMGSQCPSVLGFLTNCDHDLKLPSWCFVWKIYKFSKLNAAKGDQLLVKGFSARHQAVLCLPSSENKCCFPEQEGRMEKHPLQFYRFSVCTQRWSGVTASEWKGKVIKMCWYHDGCFIHAWIDEISLARHHTAKHFCVQYLHTMIGNEFVVAFCR